MLNPVAFPIPFHPTFHVSWVKPEDVSDLNFSSHHLSLTFSVHNVLLHSVSYHIHKIGRDTWERLEDHSQLWSLTTKHLTSVNENTSNQS